MRGRRGEEAPAPPSRVERQGRGSFEQRGRGRQPAAGASAVGRSFERGRNLFVGAGGPECAMPGLPIGIVFGVGDLRERAVRRLPIGEQR